jgi:hypothetical protein
LSKLVNAKVEKLKYNDIVETIGRREARKLVTYENRLKPGTWKPDGRGGWTKK